METSTHRSPVGAFLAAVLVSFCGSCGSPARNETVAGPTASPAAAVGGAVGAHNAVPEIVVRTEPPADDSTTPPTVYTSGPVVFNLCKSNDPDREDSLNWQFHFGDSGLPAVDEDGKFHADFARECRAEHTYRQGVYTATLRVTDKNLSDQHADVVAMAASTVQLRIVAGDTSVVLPRTCETLSVGFEEFPIGTPGPSLNIPGITFTSDGEVAANFTSWASPTNTRMLYGNAYSFTLAEPRTELRFVFAGRVPGWAVTIYGSYKGTGVFSRRMLGVVPPGGSWHEGILEISGIPYDHVFLTSGAVGLDDLVLSCK